MSSSRVGGRLNKYPKGPAPTLRGGHVTWSLLHQTMDPTFAFNVTLTNKRALAEKAQLNEQMSV